MKHTKVVFTAFSICIVLSLLICIVLLTQVKSVHKYSHMVDTGRQIVQLVVEMQLEEQTYLLRHHEEVLGNVGERIDRLRKLHTSYENIGLVQEATGALEFAAWEESMNLYERLFDQFVLYHQAVEKSIAEIRELEKTILAVIYSKMNPERGIIGLQEIRIHEKGYLLYRHYPKPPDERSFEDKRKEAVANLLVWAHEDKRIEELMERDDRLFNEILHNYESQESTLVALQGESQRMKDIGDKFVEEGDKRLKMIDRRCLFLSHSLLVIWGIMGIAVLSTVFRL